MYFINIFDGDSGAYLYQMCGEEIDSLEDTILLELGNSNAVELWKDNPPQDYMPVDEYQGHGFKTDVDGFCSLTQ